jgi:lipoteichoic acid synthase
MPFKPHSLRRWLIEIGPLTCTVAFVWGKLVYLSVFVPSEWWANEPSIGRWMRPTLSVVEAIQAYPHIASATLASLLVLFAPVPLVPRIWRFAVLLGLNLALTVLGLADLLHVRFYADVLSESSFTTPRMLRDVLPSLRDIVRSTDPMYAVDILLGLLLLPVYIRVGRGVPRLSTPALTRLSAGLLLAGLVLAAPTLHLAWRPDQGLFSQTRLRIEVASVTGLLPYHLLELIDGRGAGRSIGEPERERVRRFLDAERQRKGMPSDLFGAARGRNVIIISAESLQAFPIGLEVDGQPIAPRLTALARESLFFANFHDQTYLGTTSDAEFASLQSLHPQPVGFVAMDYGENEYRALPGMLRDHGYATLTAVAAPSDFWNADKLNPRYGFDQSVFEDAYAIPERIGPWLSDREFFTQTLPIMTDRVEPFLTVLLSSSNHHPYDLPSHHRVLRLGELEGTLLGSYLHSVHYFDHVFGEFVDRLRDTGLLDRSLLVVYGDHQGFLGDPPELAPLLGLPEWNEYHRFRVRKRVPLLIRLPHGAHAGVREVAGGHLDIAPTVLGLLGIEDDSRVMLGRDLTRDRDSLVVFRDGGFTDGAHYFVNRFGSTFSATCYEAGPGRVVDCQLLEERRREALERLEISDLIVQGNLIPALRDAGGAPGRR